VGRVPRLLRFDSWPGPMPGGGEAGRHGRPHHGRAMGQGDLGRGSRCVRAVARNAKEHSEAKTRGVGMSSDGRQGAGSTVAVRRERVPEFYGMVRGLFSSAGRRRERTPRSREALPRGHRAVTGTPRRGSAWSAQDATSAAWAGIGKGLAHQSPASCFVTAGAGQPRRGAGSAGEDIAINGFKLRERRQRKSQNHRPGPVATAAISIGPSRIATPEGTRDGGTD